MKNGKIRKNIKKNSKKGGAAGTSGSASTFFDDIFALSKSMVDTVVDTTELIIDVFELPYDIGVAYTTPAGERLKA